MDGLARRVEKRDMIDGRAGTWLRVATEFGVVERCVGGRGGEGRGPCWERTF
jgi:hypothetical protein